jgi:hypothetical protein
VKWKYFLCSKEGFKIEKNVVLPELIISENSLLWKGELRSLFIFKVPALLAF